VLDATRDLVRPTIDLDASIARREPKPPEVEIAAAAARGTFAG